MRKDSVVSENSELRLTQRRTHCQIYWFNNWFCGQTIIIIGIVTNNKKYGPIYEYNEGFVYLFLDVMGYKNKLR